MPLAQYVMENNHTENKWQRVLWGLCTAALCLGFYSSGRNYAVMAASAQAEGSSFPDNILTLDACVLARYMWVGLGEYNSCLVAHWKSEYIKQGSSFYF